MSLTVWAWGRWPFLCLWVSHSKYLKLREPHLKLLFFLSLEFCYHTSSVLCFGFWSQGMWDLSALTRDEGHAPCIARQSLNHWTAKEIPTLLVLSDMSLCCCCWYCFHIPLESLMELCTRVPNKYGKNHYNIVK